MSAFEVIKEKQSKINNLSFDKALNFFLKLTKETVRAIREKNTLKFTGKEWLLPDNAGDLNLSNFTDGGIIADGGRLILYDGKALVTVSSDGNDIIACKPDVEVKTDKGTYASFNPSV